jgi:hypothetical protein
VADFDQFMAKLRTTAGVDAVIDFIEELGDFSVKDPGGWFNQNWRGIRTRIDSLPDVDIESPPELYYSAAPDKRGRRARRAMPPAYETDAEFQRDKEMWEAELRGDVGPLNEEPNEEESA